MSLTHTHHATVVGPIRFSNRSNNCRVCKINGRRSSLVRTHHATIVFSSSLRPTEDENRMVCAGLKESRRSEECTLHRENMDAVKFETGVQTALIGSYRKGLAEVDERGSRG